MTWISELWRQLRHRLSGARFDKDLAPDAAHAAARRQFGNATQLQESSRAAWGWTLLDSWRQDIRYGLRTLAADPGFTATAVLSLALGIGANTAIFSILNAVLLRSLPVEDPQRLVQIRPGAEGDDEFTNPLWEQVRDRQQTFSGMLACAPDRFDLADGGESHYKISMAMRRHRQDRAAEPAYLRNRGRDAAVVSRPRHGLGFRCCYTHRLRPHLPSRPQRAGRAGGMVAAHTGTHACGRKHRASRPRSSAPRYRMTSRRRRKTNICGIRSS